jgi:hypothetical protein
VNDMRHGFRWWLAIYCMKRFVKAGCRLKGFWYYSYLVAWWMVYPRKHQRDFARKYHGAILRDLENWR